MEFSLYFIPYHNCRHVTTSAMLKRLGVPLEYLWGQAGLYFKEASHELVISPYYTSFKHEFEKYYGIAQHEEFIQDVDEVFKVVEGILQKGTSLAINVDLYELSHVPMYYQLSHVFHDIEILAFDGQQFTICDHYYRYHGQISYEELKKAVVSTRKHLKQEKTYMYYFSPSNKDSYSSKSILERVVASNLQVMQGTPIDLMKLEAEGATVGLEALPKIKELINEVLLSDKIDHHWYLSELFKLLKEVSNSRYNFSTFLQSFEEADMASRYVELGQHWAVVANMLIKGLVNNSYTSLVERINRRFDKLTQYEFENVDEMVKLVERLQHQK